MNKAILMGRLTKDPEVRYSQSETPIAIAKYTLAVRKNKIRNNEPEAEFIDIVAFSKLGEFAEKYFKKGMMVAILGHMHKETWEDSEHNKHSRMEVIAEEQYFAGSKLAKNIEQVSQRVESEIASTKVDLYTTKEDDLLY